MAPTSAQSVHPHHNLRYYLILTTVVVGAIFLVLYLNDGKLNPTGSVTNSIFDDVITETVSSGAIKVKEGIVAKTTSSASTKKEVEQIKEPKTTTSKRSLKKSTSEDVLDHDLTLTLDTIPLTQQENLELDLLDVTFFEHNTEIKINDDEVLSLQDLSSVTLTISNFKGDFVVDSLGLSIAGTGSELIVNGVILSTDESMKISFVDLDFSSLRLSDVQFRNFDFDKSNGVLQVDERLEFALVNNDQLILENFLGEVTYERDTTDSIQLVGQVSSLDLDGALALSID